MISTARATQPQQDLLSHAIVDGIAGTMNIVLRMERTGEGDVEATESGYKSPEPFVTNYFSNTDAMKNVAGPAAVVTLNRNRFVDVENKSFDAEFHSFLTFGFVRDKQTLQLEMRAAVPSYVDVRTADELADKAMDKLRELAERSGLEITGNRGISPGVYREESRVQHSNDPDYDNSTTASIIIHMNDLPKVTRALRNMCKEHGITFEQPGAQLTAGR